MKEDITTRKIPTASVGSLSTSLDTNQESLVAEAFLQEFDIMLYTARHLETLSSINLIINDKFTAECILDSGCQIIVIRKDVWERSMLPMIGKESMTMEVANTTTSNTLGLVKNFKVTAGDFSYFLLCQVVERTSFKILLGRPFTVVAQANMKDFHNGDQHITIFEPVTGAEQTIPTFAHMRHQIQQEGF